MALNHTNYGSERHDSWFEVEALTRTTRGSPESEYSVDTGSRHFRDAGAHEFVCPDRY